jgi:hypothetical protein
LGIDYILSSAAIKQDIRLLIKGTNPVIDKMKKCRQTFDSIVDGWQGEINVSTKKEFFVTGFVPETLPLIRGNQIGYYQTVLKPVEYCPVKISARTHHKIRRIVFQEVANAGLTRRIKGTILENVLCGHTTNYLIAKKSNIPLEAVLGLLNSSAVNFYFKFFNQTNHVPIGEIKTIPIPKIPLQKQKALTDLVERRLAGEFVDAEIDALVYQLYALTAEEIALIEGKANG